MKHVIVSGGAGFVGSHLVDYLMESGCKVTVLDNLYTGSINNISHWSTNPNFEFVNHDVINPYECINKVDQIYHLACPASPPQYQKDPMHTIKTCVYGTINMLEIAKKHDARFLISSTSEVYGDPEQHPQSESYNGNVNILGDRSCYDEGKRIAETIVYNYNTCHGIDTRIVRIFNTFGPRMNRNDGRVISNFITQCLDNSDITIYGSGGQTRSLQYVSDLVRGLTLMMGSECKLPVNLGNTEEYTVLELAKLVQEYTNSKSKIVFLPETSDDPKRRKPDISRAKRELGWEPKVKFTIGLQNTIKYFNLLDG